MTQTITATFENGVFKPAGAVDLPENTQVRLTVELLHADIQKQWDATREQRLAALESSLKLAKPLGEHLTRDQLHERR